MKNLIFTFSILIILFKTGNVLSDNYIFNVNNIEINKKNSKNKENSFNDAFLIAFDRLSKRLLLESDYKKLSNTGIDQIKELISYYQISKQEDLNKRNSYQIINVSFDKDRIHNFFYNRNILYSDIINTEVILFPLLKEGDQYYIYNKNYFYDNWIKEKSKSLIQYVLPAENIENIQKINSNKLNIFKLEISEFFKEYSNENIVFAYIEINNKNSEVYLKTRIEKKQINKSLSVKKENDFDEKDFYEKIIFEINNEILDLIKSQNLIDVRTPSFLNVEIKINKKSNLVEFKKRLEKIDLIDDFYVQKLNKDYVLVKIKYLGKISKIINKLKDQNINLKMISGQWQLTII